MRGAAKSSRRRGSEVISEAAISWIEWRYAIAYLRSRTGWIRRGKLYAVLRKPSKPSGCRSRRCRRRTSRVFKRGVEAWNRDDFDAWIDLFDPEVEWFALMEVYRGHAGVRQAWESFKGDHANHRSV